MSIPVRLEMLEAGTAFAVSQENAFGYVENVGTFPGGELVAGEFRKVVEANFRPVQNDETPVAKFCVKVVGIPLRKPAWADEVEANLRIQVDLEKDDGSGSAFSKLFDAKSSIHIFRNRVDLTGISYAKRSQYREA